MKNKLKEHPELIIIVIAFLFMAFQIGRAIAMGPQGSLIECASMYGSDSACEMCEDALIGRIPMEMDYSIDIHDNGNGLCILKDLRTGKIYVVPFDELQECIEKLNL